MSKPTTKAVLFRVDASEPEWVEISERNECELLGCKILGCFMISPHLGFLFDDEGRFAGKASNKCLAKYAPCDDYTDFCGDVLLVASDEDGETVEVKAEELASLKTILAADLKKRSEFYASFDCGVVFLSGAH